MLIGCLNFSEIGDYVYNYRFRVHKLKGHQYQHRMARTYNVCEFIRYSTNWFNLFITKLASGHGFVIVFRTPKPFFLLLVLYDLCFGLELYPIRMPSGLCIFESHRTFMRRWKNFLWDVGHACVFVRRWESFCLRNWEWARVSWNVGKTLCYYRNNVRIMNFDTYGTFNFHVFDISYFVLVVSASPKIRN